MKKDIHGDYGAFCYERFRHSLCHGWSGAPVPFLMRHAVWQTLEPVSTLSDNCRGLGVADMARCVRQGGRPQVSAEMPCHVLDIVERIMQSGKNGRVRTTETVCDRPVFFADWNTLLS